MRARSAARRDSAAADAEGSARARADLAEVFERAGAPSPPAAAAAGPEGDAAHPPVAHRRAAVLVPLVARADERSPRGYALHVVLTRRSAHLRTHAGQVAFPGGKRDAEDGSDAATALREAREEVGLRSEDVVLVLGALRPRLSQHKLSVRPVVALVSAAFEAVRQPDEVDCVFEVPLSTFAAPPVGAYAVQDIEWGGEGGHALRIHEFEHRCPTHGETFNVWGLTAHACAEVAAIVYGADAGAEGAGREERQGAEAARGSASSVVLDPPEGPRFTDLAYWDGKVVHTPTGAKPSA